MPRLFDEKRGDIVFGFPWFRGAVPPLTVGTLCAQLLLQFFADLFETLQVFLHSLKMCMGFGYNPQINFCQIFRIFNLVIFQARILSKGIDSGYLVCANTPTDF